MNPTFCKGCGKPIRWYQDDRSGKRLPLDPDPHPDGDMRVNVVRNDVARVKKGSHAPLYRLHFDTCAKPWSGPRK